MLAMVLTVMSMFLAMPKWIKYNENTEPWQVVKLKSDDLTHTLDHLEPGSWLAKKVFRLSVPAFMKLTGAPPLAVLALQFLCGFLLLVFCYKLVEELVADKVSAVFITAAMAFTYFGRAAFYDAMFLWFDGFAYFLLLMALYCSRPWLIFLFASAAAWTDERAFIGLSIVMLFHLMKSGGLKARDLPSAVRGGRFLAAFAAAGLYLAIRLWLQYSFGMKTPTDGAKLQVLFQAWFYLPLGSWTFMEGLWLAALVFFIVALSRRDYLLPGLVLATLLVFTMIAGCVYDITRSGSYAMPIVFVIVSYLSHRMIAEEQRFLYFSAFAISLLFPPLFVCSVWKMEYSISSPVFIQLLRLVI
ncbi:MAG: hypothetical protein RI973_2445 [Bacteroidota bacterium]